MKKLFFLLSVAIATNLTAQNNAYIVSTDGIGAIKLHMPQVELEELLNKKIPLTNPGDTISGSWQDSAKIKYKNIDIHLEFVRSYFAEDTFQMVVSGIRTSSVLCKTKYGIGIGSDKLKIIAAYEDYFLTIQPGFFNYYNTEKSKTKSTISIEDDSKRILRFYLLNKKVVSFEITTSSSAEE
jgi:hypothetical protein